MENGRRSFVDVMQRPVVAGFVCSSPPSAVGPPLPDQIWPIQLSAISLQLVTLAQFNNIDLKYIL